jgi:anti-sigma28 factor (negative regulator of flagellin synthesis)
MRIDPNAVAVTATTLETAKPVSLALRRRPTTKPASVVKLSSAGAALAAEPSSPRTTARIERIRALLDAGEYPIDLDQLATRIVADDVLREGACDGAHDGAHAGGTP